MDLFSAIQALAALLLLYAVLSFVVTALEVTLTMILELRSKYLKRELRFLVSSNDRRGLLNSRMNWNKISIHPTPNSFQESTTPDQSLGSEQDTKARRFIELLYERPYIQSLTLEEKIFSDSNRIEDSSSDAITTALVDLLRINWLVHKLIEIRLKRFIGRIESNINRIISECNLYNLLEQPSFKYLEKNFSDIVSSFNKKEIDTLTCIDLILNNLDTWLSSFDDTHEIKKCVERLKAFREKFFNKDFEHLKASAGLSPTPTEIVNAIDVTSPTYVEIKSNLNDRDKRIFKDFETTLSTLPKSLIYSLYSIAERTEINSSTGNESISKFYEEIKAWIRKALQKEENTYRRNTRGFALLVGYILVIILNVDAFNFFSTFTYRYDLRDIAIDSIKKTIKGDQPIIVKDLNFRLEATEDILKSFPNPIGWSSQTLQHQFELPSTESFNPSIFSSLHLLRVMIGWMISSGAISMGGPFWLDLFSRFVNIKR